jgi:hypothetical protein
VPLPDATMHRIEPASISDRNATSEVVHAEVDAITDFHDGYEMLLPPHSVRAVLWHN